MKKTLLSLLLGVSCLTLAPSAAMADHRHYHHSCERRVAYRCHRCGDAVYEELRLVGHDHCGRPIYNWVRADHSCHYREHCYDNEIRIGGLRFRF